MDHFIGLDATFSDEQRARVLGAFYAFGRLVGAITLIVGAWPGANEGRLALLTTAAGLAGAAMLLRPRLMPRWACHGAVALGITGTCPGAGLIVGHLMAHVRALAGTDPLTGAPSRRAADLLMSGALARAERSGGPLSLVFLDLDRFKQLNDADGTRSATSCSETPSPGGPTSCASPARSPDSAVTSSWSSSSAATRTMRARWRDDWSAPPRCDIALYRAKDRHGGEWLPPEGWCRTAAVPIDRNRLKRVLARGTPARRGCPCLVTRTCSTL